MTNEKTVLRRSGRLFGKMIEQKITRNGIRFTVALVVFVALASGIIFFKIRFGNGLGPEPVYLGRDFSAWFNQVMIMDYGGPLPSESKSALSAIRVMGPAAVPFLARHATAREPGINSLRRMVRERWPAALPFLSGPERPEYWENEKAVWCLGELGSVSRSALDAITNSPVQYTKAPIFEAWAKIEPTNPVPVQELCKLMKSGGQTDRFFAALGLGHCNPAIPGVIETLVAGLKDTDIEVRANSAYSLGGIGPTACVAIPDLQHEASTSTFARLQFNAARALWKIDPSQVGFTLEALGRMLNGKNNDQWNALKLLSELGPAARAAIPALEEFKPPNRESRHLRDELLTMLRSLPAP